ncbi:MAG: class I SAM-dependent RNA methyltransferase [Verrucomicrobia bacterium]|nr:class I SAM-dependent RNA methyltransferase [Verrucomicrobiota bacterium]
MTGVVEVQITDVAFGGKGVGRVNGKAAFVSYVIDGETVSVRITGEKRRFVEAELVAVARPSAHRVTPPCPYFGRCGGCVYQHIEYGHQLAIKTRQVKQALARIGGLIDVPVLPMIASPLEYGYRNRITVHVRDGVIGFFQRESDALIDVERCPISSDDVNAELAQLRAAHPGEGHYTLRGRKAPRVFAQANDRVAAAMLDVVDWMLAGASGTLIDAYCGAGFFAKRLRNRFARVIGIDWDAHAIALAERDAQPHERYIAGRVEDALLRELECCAIERGERANSTPLIVDPPAEGLSSSVRQAIAQLRPDRCIYISCNPATLARDLRELRSSFRIDSITPLDMFPQTAEIEAIAELTTLQRHIVN